MPNQTDREIIDALLRQLDPYNTPQGAPDILAQLGARLESAGTQLEGSLQARNELERFAELIPRWLAANPMQEAGALLQMREPEVEQLKTMAREAAADPMGTAEAVGRAAVGAVKDPLGTAEKLSLLDIVGGGKALGSLGRMARKLRGPDLIESVIPEARVERPRTQPVGDFTGRADPGQSWYHGTPAERRFEKEEGFDVSGKSQFGPHFGEEATARERLNRLLGSAITPHSGAGGKLSLVHLPEGRPVAWEDVPKMRKSIEEGFGGWAKEDQLKFFDKTIGNPRIIETEVSLKNPLRMNDVIMWSAHLVLKQLLEREIISQRVHDRLVKRGNRRVKALEEARTGRALEGDEDWSMQRWVDENAEARASVVKEYLESKGYDGISYKNEWEGGESVIAFRPEQIRVINSRDVTGNIMPVVVPFGLVATAEAYMANEEGL